MKIVWARLVTLKKLLEATPPDRWHSLEWVQQRREIYRESDRPDVLRWEVYVDHEAPVRDRFRFILFTPQYDHWIGVGHQEMSGKTPWAVLSPGDAAKVTYQYQQCVDTTTPVDATGVIPFSYPEYLNIGGQWRWWSTVLLPVFEGDRVWKLIGTCQQITSTEADLRTALKDGNLAVHYQPICYLSSECLICHESKDFNAKPQCIVGWEALIRWPGSGYSPGDFLPIAKASGVIQQITDLVIWEAAAILAELPQEQWVSINVANDLFETEIEKACQHYQVAPHRLRLEVTEDCNLTPTTIARFRYARFIGHLIELDDFWVERSNVGWIDLVKPIALKLDRQFVTGAHRDSNKAHICKVAIALAKNYDPPMQIIVEGIETVEDMMFLASLGADYGQGWLFGKAIPREELWNLL